MKEAEERVAFWRGHWTAWAESGLSQRAYCARAGVGYAAFRSWRNRVHAAPVAASTPTFVPMVVEPPEAALPVTEVPAPLEGGAGIEIRLAHGRTIRVAADFDAAVLTRVIRVLEQMPC